MLLEENQIVNTLTPEKIIDIIDKRAPLGLKKMLIMAHSKDNIAYNPTNIGSPRYLQESRRQWYLDLIIPLLGDLCPNIGEITEKEEKMSLTKNIVYALLNELKKILQKYNSKDLLIWMMTNYEAILHEKALSKMRLPARLYCFDGHEDIIEEIKTKSQISDETALACRCLIEHLASEATFGTNPISLNLIDDTLAIMSYIVYWGGVGEQIKYDLFNVKLAILPSKRIGTNSNERLESFFNEFIKARTREYINDSIEDFTALYSTNEITNNISPEGFRNAFADTFGISFEKLGGIVHLLIHYGLEQKEQVARLSILQIKELIMESFDDEMFSENEIAASIQFLYLWNREDVKNVPKGFSQNDISPWRYNRRLSYLQRPLILIDYGKDSIDPMIYWTPRLLDQSWKYLNHLFLSGRYRSPDKSKLERQISKLSKGRGAVLQDKVIEWLKSNQQEDLFQDVTISPNGLLKNTKDLGDVDILSIDHGNNVILSIECKRTEQARSIKEMVEQVEEYHGGGSKRGYFERHANRHVWLIENIEKVGLFCKSEITHYDILSLFTTYDILAIQYMTNKPLPMPVYSLFDLKNISYADLIEQLKNNYRDQNITTKKHAMQGSAGSLRVNLAWGTKDDLDLWVETPHGKISYENKEIRYKNTIGKLDIDANANLPYVSNPQENIYWDNIPSGTHKIRVNFFTYRERSEIKFTLSIIPQVGNGIVLSSKIDFHKQRTVDVAEFEIIDGQLIISELL